ncbi:protein CASC3 [Carex littledalei]|uniref:Protein CASC3 n=1 Tax=Carex littledalei TaxID=544730 RepID=A0A833QSH8_9POAL|nr:protein CASC3 [Carex littledalei]
MAGREERKREMDRRDGRDSYSRRRDSRREREPSPKKLRRDRERDEKRIKDLGCADSSGRDSKNKNSSRDIERARDIKSPEANRSIYGLKDSSETKNDGGSDVNRLHPDPKEFARSKIYLQHDGRGSSGQVQIHVRHDTDNMRSDLREHRSAEKLNEKTEVEAKHTTRKNDYSVRDQDRLFQLDSGLPSEKKMPPESEPELGLKTPNKEPKLLDSAKNDEKKLDTRDDTFRRRDDRVVSREKLSRPWRDDRFGRREGGFNRENENRNGNWLPRNDYRDRFSGRAPPRGRERFSSARFSDRNQLQHVTGAQTDRWKHDKYEEANQSLTNEEDEIAKVEQLLAL